MTCVIIIAKLSSVWHDGYDGWVNNIRSLTVEDDDENQWGTLKSVHNTPKKNLNYQSHNITEMTFSANLSPTRRNFVDISKGSQVHDSARHKRLVFGFFRFRATKPVGRIFVQKCVKRRVFERTCDFDVATMYKNIEEPLYPKTAI